MAPLLWDRIQTKGERNMVWKQNEAWKCEVSGEGGNESPQEQLRVGEGFSTSGFPA